MSYMKRWLEEMENDKPLKILDDWKEVHEKATAPTPSPSAEEQCLDMTPRLIMAVRELAEALIVARNCLSDEDMSEDVHETVRNILEREPDATIRS